MNKTEKFLFFATAMIIFLGFFVIFHESAHAVFNYNKGVASNFSITTNGFATIPDENKVALLSESDKRDLFWAHSFNEAIAYNVFPIGAMIFAVLLLGVIKNEY